jgi:hypothetical protein
MVSVLATMMFLNVVNLLGGVCWDASCLVFDFPGENLSSVHRRGGDSGFDVVSLLEASIWKSEIMWTYFTCGGQLGECLKI